MALAAASPPPRPRTKTDTEQSKRLPHDEPTPRLTDLRPQREASAELRADADSRYTSRCRRARSPRTAAATRANDVSMPMMTRSAAAPPEIARLGGFEVLQSGIAWCDVAPIAVERHELDESHRKLGGPGQLGEAVDLDLGEVTDGDGVHLDGTQPARRRDRLEPAEDLRQGVTPRDLVKAVARERVDRDVDPRSIPASTRAAASRSSR